MKFSLTRLTDAVADRRDRKRTQLLAAGPRDEHPACGKRTPAPVLQVCGRERHSDGEPSGISKPPLQ
jgi:hypothetical protein